MGYSIKNTFALSVLALLVVACFVFFCVDVRVDREVVFNDFSDVNRLIFLDAESSVILKEIQNSNFHELDKQSRLVGAPIHYATIKGMPEVVEALVERGVDVDSMADYEGRNGVTPLHIASMTDKILVARRLIKLGANPNKLSADGKNAFDYAVEYQSDLTLAYLKKKKRRQTP